MSNDEHGWYNFDDNSGTEPTEYYFKMSRGRVKKMLIVRRRFIICTMSHGRYNSRKVVMPDITGFYTNDALKGCFRMYGMDEYAVAAKVFQSEDVNIIDVLSPAMVAFRTKTTTPIA